ncbi:MAG: DUF1501 domain-containing protein, partial [Planctomycetota bacterium]
PDLLKAEAQAGIKNSHRAIINIFLPGGPPHQDMFDLKPDAPREIRGEFRPIETNVSGLQICELFPRLAKMADKYSLIRSIVGATGSHYSFQCFTGRDHRRQPPGGWPSMGSMLSKLYGSAKPGVPPFVGLSPKMGHVPWSDPGQAGFLGHAHGPFQPNGDGKDDLTLNGISLDRLRDRESLLASFDKFRRQADASGLMDGMDAFNRQAFGVLTSSRLAEALDLSKESKELRDRYGRGSAKNQADGGPKLLDQFLLARRLVEAGVRCVTLAFSRWDWHGGNFTRGRQDMPMLDQGLSALIEDLHHRGLNKDVTVVVWGEFGRTPRINKSAGRDHWPKVSCGLVACGNLRGGQVIGSTTRDAGEAKDRPVTFQEVFATLYHSMGIDPHQVTVDDLHGRPQYLVDAGYRPMPELI